MQGKPKKSDIPRNRRKSKGNFNFQGIFGVGAVDKLQNGRNQREIKRVSAFVCEKRLLVERAKRGKASVRTQTRQAGRRDGQRFPFVFVSTLIR